MFHKDGDYLAFLKLLKEASARIPMRLLSFCLMPNHFHLVLWPRQDGDLTVKRNGKSRSPRNSAL